MAVTIRLSRYGRRNLPFYRLVVADKDMPRDGRHLEVVGTYDPRTDGGKFSAKRERIQYWLKCGARPSETVAQLLKRYPQS